MYDILEGVGGYEIKLVLNSLIEQKVMTLEQLNYRLTSFNYGFCDASNKPCNIKPDDLKNPDWALKGEFPFFYTWTLFIGISTLIYSPRQFWCSLESFGRYLDPSDISSYPYDSSARGHGNAASK